MMTGNMQAKATSKIFERLSIPNHKIKIGRNAIFGEGNPRATRGSANHSMARFRAISSPKITPPTVARNSPQMARPRLSERSATSVPSSVECNNCSATTENGGSNIAGATCLTLEGPRLMPDEYPPCDSEQRTIGKKGDYHDAGDRGKHVVICTVLTV